ncbi:MAG: hypothetical protein M5U28_43265 [Sandaracinaceae bacterium]|nr:hypothetical protein [Sandaracinaceae bacterium]
MNGQWAITYDDTLSVEIQIGGATYDAEIPAEGGTVHVEHGGLGFDFTLDCSRDEVVCPSEAWPSTVTAEQREPSTRTACGCASRGRSARARCARLRRTSAARARSTRSARTSATARW